MPQREDEEKTMADLPAMTTEDELPDHYITAGQHTETGQWHGLFYRNHPTPSGCYRPMLSLSTKQGFASAEAARDDMAKNFRASGWGVDADGIATPPVASPPSP